MLCERMVLSNVVQRWLLPLVKANCQRKPAFESGFNRKFTILSHNKLRTTTFVMIVVEEFSEYFAFFLWMRNAWKRHDEVYQQNIHIFWLWSTWTNSSSYVHITGKPSLRTCVTARHRCQLFCQQITCFTHEFPQLRQNHFNFCSLKLVFGGKQEMRVVAEPSVRHAHASARAHSSLFTSICSLQFVYFEKYGDLKFNESPFSA